MFVVPNDIIQDFAAHNIAEGFRCNHWNVSTGSTSAPGFMHGKKKKQNKKMWLWPFETHAGTVTKLFCQSYAVCNHRRGIVEKKRKSPESLKSYIASGVNIFGAWENEPLMKWDIMQKLQVYWRRGFFSRRGVKVRESAMVFMKYALMLFRLTATQPCAYTNTGKDFLKFLCVCWIMHWEDTLGEKRYSLGNGISFCWGKHA